MSDKNKGRKPYIVQRNGNIVERATGRLIGRVRIIDDAWTGYVFGPDYPDDPWQQQRVQGLGGRRWSVARDVWQTHVANARPERGAQC